MTMGTSKYAGKKEAVIHNWLKLIGMEDVIRQREQEQAPGSAGGEKHPGRGAECAATAYVQPSEEVTGAGEEARLSQ